MRVWDTPPPRRRKRRQLAAKPTITPSDALSQLALLTVQFEQLQEMINSIGSLRRGTVIAPGISGHTYYVRETGETGANGFEYKNLFGRPIPGTPRVSGGTLISGDDFNGIIAIQGTGVGGKVVATPPDSSGPNISNWIAAIIAFSNPQPTAPPCALASLACFPGMGDFADIAFRALAAQDSLSIYMFSPTGATVSHTYSNGLPVTAVYCNYYCPPEDFWVGQPVVIGEHDGSPVILGAIND